VARADLKLAAGNRVASLKAGLLYPLDAVYRRVGVPIPRVRLVDAEDIPFPYRTLLVHTNDMTLTIEAGVTLKAAQLAAASEQQPAAAAGEGETAAPPTEGALV